MAVQQQLRYLSRGNETDFIGAMVSAQAPHCRQRKEDITDSAWMDNKKPHVNEVCVGITVPGVRTVSPVQDRTRREY